MGSRLAFRNRVDVRSILSMDRGRTKVHGIRRLADDGIYLSCCRAVALTKETTLVHTLASLGSHRLRS
jgi:hypothetical protein